MNQLPHASATTISLSMIERRIPCLNGQVALDKFISPQVCGDLVRCQGTLHPTGMIVIVKHRRFVSANDERAEEHALHGPFIWSLLDHENIQPLLGFLTVHNNTMSTVAEWMVSGSVFVQDPSVDPTPLLLGLSRALLYLHTHPSGPIVHGDVRGENVLIANDGRALLTNFHCASFPGSPPAFPWAVGSLRWMSPEGIDGNEATAERDMWAFGMTALELFTTQLPFGNITSRNAIIFHILFGPPDQPACMTDDWWDVCTSCWRLEPGLRPNALDLVKKIEEISLRHGSDSMKMARKKYT